MDKIIKEFPSFANKVFLIDTGKGLVVKKEFLVLDEKQIRISQKVRERISSTIAVPRLLKNKDGDTLTSLRGAAGDVAISFFEISEYIPNTPIIHANISLQQIEEIGEILGKIHKTKLPVIAPARPSGGRNKVTKQSLRSPRFARDDDRLELSTVDFIEINQQIEERIEEFLSLFDQIIKHAPLDVRQKLKTLKEFIEHTEKARHEYLKDKPSFYSSEKVLTHGDISLRNFLLSNPHPNPLPARQGEGDYGVHSFLIDWDNVAMNSPMFELQRSIGTICGRGMMNGNLEAPNFEKVKMLLNGYQKIYILDLNDIYYLSEAAQYCFLIFWLHFTLQQILKKDFRILTFVPEKLENMLWWEKNLKKYKEFLNTLIQ